MLARRNSNHDVERTQTLRPFFDLEGLFRDFGFPELAPDGGDRWHVPAAELTETDDAYEVRVDLPGHDPKDLDVKLEGDTLTIRAERLQTVSDKKRRFFRSERHYGLFARSFVLPDGVDASKADARYEHGVLTVTVPKREEARPKAIQIRVNG